MLDLMHQAISLGLLAVTGGEASSDSISFGVPSVSPDHRGATAEPRPAEVSS
jgi:hypothetical protein